MSPRSIVEMLSNELLVTIFHLLLYLDVVRCRAICQKFRLIIDETASLQLMIELAAAGDPGYTVHSAKGTIDVLEHFRAVQKMYRAPLPRGRPKEDLFHIELTYLIAAPNHTWYDDSMWYQFGEFLVGCIQADMGDHGTYFDVIWLGTGKYKGKDGKTPERYRSIHVEGQWELAAIDFEQDLIVLIALRRGLRFLSLRTGQPHAKMAKALNGLLEVQDHLCPLSIVGEWVLFSKTYIMGGDIYLYHWPSGQERKVWRIHRENFPIDTDLRGYIVDEFLIMPTHTHGSDSPTPGPFIGSFNVYLLPRTGGEVADPRLIAVFELPNMTVKVAHIESFQRTIATGAHTTWGAGTIQALLRMQLGHAEFSVSVNALLSESVRLAADKPDEQPVLRIPWESWGPHSLHPMDGESHFVPVVVAGLRIIYDRVMLDFNQYDGARDIYSPTSTAMAGGTVAVQDTSTVRVGRVNSAPPGGGHTTQAEPALRVMGPRYRQIPCSVGPSRRLGLHHGDVYVIEEEDGPKLVEMSWTDTRAPRRLTFRKF